MDNKRTFIDPKTGEEIESTALARYAPPLLVLLPISVSAWTWTHHRHMGSLGHALVYGLVGGAVMAAFMAWFASQDPDWLLPPLRRMHNAIARWQHQRRKAEADEHL